ncbi:MAG: c-type cytochrome [Salinarimonas sp.]
MALGALAGIVGLVVVAAIVGLATVYGGLYNVAATEEHTSFTRWTLDTTLRNSVETRAEELGLPEAIPAALVARGAATYKASCQTCHGGPGVERAGWASGMRPRPPHLAEAAAAWRSSRSTGSRRTG